MKKFYLFSLIAAMFAMSFNALAIENPYPKGTFIGSAHFGFYPGIGANIAGDYVIEDSWWEGHFTLGGYIGFNTRHYEYVYLDEGYYDRWTNFAIMPRATYGINISQKFEAHIGLMLGYCYSANYWEWKNVEYHYNGDDSWKHHGFEYGAVLGCRYQFTNSFAGDFELNYTPHMSYINIGVAFKL